jgi:hypothetical protein
MIHSHVVTVIESSSETIKKEASDVNEIVLLFGWTRG